MPFGMVNAPATFVRMMNRVLEGCGEFADSFIDDIGVYSNTWEDHMKHLRTVCRCLREANLSARPSKCSLGQSKVEFLAHMVGQGKVSPTQDKVKAILSYPRPQTKKQVRSFLGTVGFYREIHTQFLPTGICIDGSHQERFADKGQMGTDSSEVIWWFEVSVDSYTCFEKSWLSENLLLKNRCMWNRRLCCSGAGVWEWSSPNLVFEQKVGSGGEELCSHWKGVLCYCVGNRDITCVSWR